jgi:hypothetical protein
MKKIICLLVLITTVFLGACKKDFNPGGTQVQSLAGEYWVQIDDGTGYSTAYYKISTYNTAANVATEMWIDDADAVFGMKGKVSVNISALTFNGTNIANAYSDGPPTFTIQNGLVTKKGAVGPGSGDKTDAIYFEAKFAGDATTYKFKGYARTGFDSDDH